MSVEVESMPPALPAMPTAITPTPAEITKGPAAVITQEPAEDSKETAAVPATDRAPAAVTTNKQRITIDGITYLKQRITFDDWLALSELTFEWGDSYDTKDWNRLREILAPTLMVDYTEVGLPKWDAMSSEEFVGIMSHKGFVGDPLVNTQHHVGASKFEKISDTEVIGSHQLRAAHQRYTGPDRKTVENKGHGHAMIKHWYKKIDGEWKFAGLKPSVRWNEFEFEKIFKGLDHTE
ncbi:MAG: centractin- actin- protein of the dynactin complex [Pycnora praestabilis]|nr:MAG: centractin- actin- protein of the dynactin complex [Pycnora praestabilis]